ncbi:RHS repeat domain-containing protein [Microbulbifer sp. 2304DJ12-6]|uniref:RHS repeat domain-containing protein n=1 Tax=Microbulbifer sp. 2304DJ12-6 TaxID=3233340 RepID=UPI0039B08ABC
MEIQRANNPVAKLITIVVLIIAIQTFHHPALAMELYFIHNDHLDTPQVVTDQNQQIVWRGRYKPFGETEEEISIVEQYIRFPGQYEDRETGLHYNYYRDYDPSTGRYLQSDPTGFEGGINTYLYVLANPINYFDDLGLAPSGKNVDLGGGSRVRIDNPHVPGQQKHAHFETSKGSGVVNQDGTQSHKNSGSLDNMNKKVKKFLQKKGFKLRCPACMLIPFELSPEAMYCEINPDLCIEVPMC